MHALVMLVEPVNFHHCWFLDSASVLHCKGSHVPQARHTDVVGVMDVIVKVYHKLDHLAMVLF